MLLALIALTSSHEQQLNELFEIVGRAKTITATISRSAASGRSGVLYENGNVYLEFSRPNHFRVEQMTMWGEGPDYICDGKTFAVNDLNGTFTLKPAAKTFWEADGTFGPGGGTYSLVNLLIEGPSALPKVMKKGAKGGVSAHGFWFENPEGGKVEITVEEKSSSFIRLVVDTRNMAQKMAQYVALPIWNERPEDALDRQAITISLNPRISARRFNTTPPNGMNVNDERPKPPVMENHD